MINIEGLNKADVLAALYNAAVPMGMGFLQYDKTPMTREVAEKILAKTKYFDYLKGRPMKLDLADDKQFEERLYDRDQGDGGAQWVIDHLRAGTPVDDEQSFLDSHRARMAGAVKHGNWWVPKAIWSTLAHKKPYSLWGRMSYLSLWKKPLGKQLSDTRAGDYPYRKSD